MNRYGLGNAKRDRHPEPADERVHRVNAGGRSRTETDSPAAADAIHVTRG